jgi:DNA-directed RNA polymerase specialized sigma24 family protein
MRDETGRIAAMDEPAAREGEAGLGDERGWDEFAPLYDEHHERLYRVALLLCHGDTALAEDAVTETFLRVFEQWKHGKVENFFPFARQVLVQQVLGERRDGNAAPRRARDRRGAGRHDPSITGASSTFQLLEQLAAEDRTAVVLRYFEDLSYDQIAATMGVSSGTAKAQVAVGLQRMRSMMDEDTA